jgi:hypothetical protein
MGSSPSVVNYKGEVLTDQMREYLFGRKNILGEEETKLMAPDRAREIFSNWMFGLRPQPVDPAEGLARESGVSRVRERASAGMGVGGLFGIGSDVGDLPTLPSLDMGPMHKGVPYEVPPLPKMPRAWM